MSFVKAVRSRAKLKIALTGPSGAGKTYSALRLATGILLAEEKSTGKKGNIAFIDTENNSSNLYADRFDFDVLNITPPYTTEKFIDALKLAHKAGYDLVIADSISHFWASEGGLLEQKDLIDSRGKGNGYTNWATITKKHESFKSVILQAPYHLICTMRSKQDYILVEKNGKQTPQKVGMAPIQREGMEFEFTTVFDLAMDNSAASSKDRTSMYPPDKIFMITEETGQQFINWLHEGQDVAPPAAFTGIEKSKQEPKPQSKPASQQQNRNSPNNNNNRSQQRQNPPQQQRQAPPKQMSFNEALIAMYQAYDRLGVGLQDIINYFGYATERQFTSKDLVTLRDLYKQIMSGEQSVRDLFLPPEEHIQEPEPEPSFEDMDFSSFEEDQEPPPHPDELNSVFNDNDSQQTQAPDQLQEPIADTSEKKTEAPQEPAKPKEVKNHADPLIRIAKERGIEIKWAGT